VREEKEKGLRVQPFFGAKGRRLKEVVLAARGRRHRRQGLGLGLGRGFFSCLFVLFTGNLCSTAAEAKSMAAQTNSTAAEANSAVAEAESTTAEAKSTAAQVMSTAAEAKSTAAEAKSTAAEVKSTAAGGRLKAELIALGCAKGVIEECLRAVYPLRCICGRNPASSVFDGS